MEQIRVRRLTGRFDRRGEHRAGMGVSLELGKHSFDVMPRYLGSIERGRLITIEGIDGAGKSTLAAGLLDSLLARQIDVELLREPGGVHTAERIRELVKDPQLVIGARAEALLYAAARAQLIEEAVLPLLHAGRSVLLDRFVDSSLAYQGAGRQLGIGPVRDVNLFATGGLTPDRTLLLILPPHLGRARSTQRGEALDRLELERDDFHARIAEAYEQLARQEPERIRRIDGTAAPEDVLARSLDALGDLF
jgi:dTMP kinase